MARIDDPHTEDLHVALEHAWAWYSMRFGQFLQLLNFTLVGYAILSAAYVTALNSAMPAIASAVGVLAALLSVAVAAASRLIERRADIAAEPLKALQDKLAQRTGVDSLRMFAASASGVRWRSRWLAHSTFLVVALAWLAAAAYPLR